MNKKEYLNSLLALCTEKQQNVFSRMYPDGPQKSQVNHAVFQLENTLKNLNKTNEDLVAIKRDMKELEAGFSKQIFDLEQELENAEAKLVETYILIERLENPINIENNDIQERLNLLNALEAGGVDNWDGYDDALNTY